MKKSKTISVRFDEKTAEALERIIYKKNVLLRGIYETSDDKSEVIRNAICYIDKFVDLSNDDNFKNYFGYSIRYAKYIYKNEKITTYDKERFKRKI